MSAIPVIITLGNPGPDDCPTNLTETFAFIRELISAEILANIVPYITGATTPAVEDQNKIWHKVDVNGRPLGTYVFYSGAWRKQYSGKLGEIVFYSGDPAADFSETGGKGTVGGDWDGWQLCNGNNGSPDLSDKFIVGAKMSDLGVGYSGNEWKTTVSGDTLPSGGAKDITLTDATTFRPAHDAITMSNWQADGNSPNSGGGLWGLGGGHVILPADAGNATPTAIPTLPPYIAFGYALFQGYA